MPIQDITGERFGRWTVISLHDRVRYQYPKGGSTALRWLCRCDCGNEKVVRGQSLKNGKSVSCRCYQQEFQRKKQARHGQAQTPEYAAWAHMMDRCKNEKNPEFKNYGARGITVCERWKTAANFLADMSPRPSAKHSLERIDNSLGYGPDNCRWATSPEQCNNTRSNRRLRFNGQVKTIAQWASDSGIKAKTLRKRLDSGWTTAEALTIPVDSDPTGWNVRRLRHGVTPGSRSLPSGDFITKDIENSRC